MPRYIVYSPGRTGSTLICRNINKHYGRDVAYAVHNPHFVHSDSFIPAGDDLVCIMSTRQNILQASLSQLVLEQSNEPTEYTNKTMEPFTANITKFSGLVSMYKNFYNTVNISKYKKVVEINFEDIFNDEYYLFRCIDISEKTDLSLCRKSPYDYSTLITNINELKEIFNELR